MSPMESTIPQSKSHLSFYGELKLASYSHLGTLLIIVSGPKNKADQWTHACIFEKVYLGMGNLIKLCIGSFVPFYFF